MSQAVYVRLFPEDLDFIKKYTLKEKTDKSKFIKNLIHKTIKQIKLNEAIDKYKEGTLTIREGAKLVGWEYREFLNELCKKNLIGPTKEEEEKIIKDTLEYFS